MAGRGRRKFFPEAETLDVSSFEEPRVTTLSPATAEQVCGAVWNGNSKGLERGFKRRDTLKETSLERWTYEQITAPLVSDRDYTLHVTRELSDQGCKIV